MTKNQQFGDWQVVESIAKGSIFRVRAQGSGDTDYVLKVHHNPETMQRIKKLTTNILHPNILNVFDFGIKGDSHYSVSEYCEFGDLRTLETSSHHWLRLACQTFDAIEFLHCCGYRKADNNPKNVFVKRGLHDQLAAVIGDLDSLCVLPGRPTDRMSGLYSFFYQKIEDQGHQTQLGERRKKYRKLLGLVQRAF